MKALVTRIPFTVSGLRQTVLESKLTEFSDDIQEYRSLFEEEGDTVELFITPKAFSSMKKFLTSPDVANPTHFFFNGIECKTPVFDPTEVRDLENVSDGKVEFRIWRNK